MADAELYPCLAYSKVCSLSSLSVWFLETKIMLTCTAHWSHWIKVTGSLIIRCSTYNSQGIKWTQGELTLMQQNPTANWKQLDVVEMLMPERHNGLCDNLSLADLGQIAFWQSLGQRSQSDRWHSVTGRTVCGVHPGKYGAVFITLGTIKTQIIVSGNTPNVSSSKRFLCIMSIPGTVKSAVHQIKWLCRTQNNWSNSLAEFMLDLIHFNHWLLSLRIIGSVEGKHISS